MQPTPADRLQGYLDSLPEPNVRLEAEIEASKSTVADLRGQLDTVKSALAEAKERLAERAENKKTVDAAKATAAQLAVRHFCVAEVRGSKHFWLDAEEALQGCINVTRNPFRNCIRFSETNDLEI